MNGVETYWVGTGLWLAGFLLYVAGSYWRPSARMYRAGSFLCWIGFLTTVIPYFYNDDALRFQLPMSVDPRQFTPENVYSLVRIGWMVGFGLVVASWLDIVRKPVGWAGFIIGMAAATVSWTDDRQIQAVTVVVAVVMMLMLIVSASRKHRGPGPTRKYKSEATGLSDSETELSVLCLHDKQVVERLIEHERSQRPGMSRKAAAAAAAKRLIRDRR